MGLQNSEVILAKNIKMDKDYNNVINYSESNMVNLVRANHVANATNFSFIRNTNKIQVPFSYGSCLQANYVAFQNSNYNNKWFFAFINKVEYKGDNNTEIEYTIDVWSTWFSYWTAQPCYVLREHVNDDHIGNYTLPEGLETGEYIIDDIIEFTGLENMSYIIQVSEYVSTEASKPLATNYGGVYAAGGAYICDNINQVVNILQSYADGRTDAILAVYMCPTEIILNSNESLQYSGQATPAYLQQYIDKPSTIDSYTPKNKKLLTFPYCYLNVSNNNGMINSYLYELFRSDDAVPSNQVMFNIKGVPTVGASIKAVPFNYKNYEASNYEDEGVIAGKFPTLSWSEDAYTNWLTQNSVNIGIGVASNLLQLVSGLSSGNIGLTASGSFGIASQIGQIYQHSLVPYTAKGNTNGGDINSCSKTNTFYFYKMSIRQEYARVIDDYFTRYGYKINRIKTPNITGRPIFNYIEIASNDAIGTGSVPAEYMDVINNICRKGVTIWHNHENIQNYSLNNQN